MSHRRDELIMKKKIIFLIIMFMVFLPTVFADNNYYKSDDGNYWLCGSSGPCFYVTPSQSGVSFDLRNEHINYEGMDYYYNEELQEKYFEDQQGISRMYYYMKGNNYILCKTNNSCKTYTFDSLMKLEASIYFEDRIEFPSTEGPGASGEKYYFNRFIKTDDNEQSGSSSEIPKEKPTYEAKTDYCTRLKEPLQFLGRVVLIVKILIPIVIIAFGMLDFFKAVTGAKDDEIKKSARSFAFRCASGVIIFFIPTLVSLIFSLVSDFANIKGDFNACQKCIFRVTECK